LGVFVNGCDYQLVVVVSSGKAVGLVFVIQCEQLPLVGSG